MEFSSTAAQKSFPLDCQPAGRSTAPLATVEVARGSMQLSALALWHLCSLDAPCVATIWTLFLAAQAGVALTWTTPLSMFLAVWIVYAGDRLLDARTSSDIHERLEERHRFHRRHSSIFVSLIAICSVLLCGLLPRLPREELLPFSALGIALIGYFAMIHRGSRSNDSAGASRLPKEFAVGAFFALAVFIPTAACRPNHLFALISSALMFAIVCTLNCVFVYAWEHPTGLINAHWSTRFAVSHLTALSTFSMALLAVFTMLPSPERMPFSVATACLTSVALFFLLHQFRQRIGKVELRALVDLALLVPVPLLLISALSH